MQGGGSKRTGEQTYVDRRILIKIPSQDDGEDAFYIGTVTSVKKVSARLFLTATAN